MTLEQVRDLVRSAAHSIPPSDAGSTRAINAIAGAVWERLNKLTWQVRDTCARAEKAEASLKRIADLAKAAGADPRECQKALFVAHEIALKAAPAFNAIPEKE